MKIIWLAIVAIQCLAHVRSENEIDYRIINGQPANLTEIYYQVSVQIRANAASNYVSVCGGVIGNLNNVITAAQCLYLNRVLVQPSMVRVVSDTIQTSGGQIRNVSKIVIHENYVTGKFDNDIAIIKLSTPFNETKTLKSITMNTSKPKKDTKCVTSGYGTGSVLMRADVLIEDTGVCKKIYQDMTDNMICAGKTNSTICAGDGGGPLVCGGKLTGVSIFTITNCSAAFPAGYSSIYQYSKWVTKNGGFSAKGSMIAVVLAALLAHLY